jgi:glycosyltransferase involved in cell wall biosynthesis
MSETYTVVIPTYNRAKFISRAILSVVNQDCIPTSNIQVLVIDDESTDNTKEIVASLSVPSAILRYVRVSHSGCPGVVRNIALDRATGDYIAYCDSDDFWFPNHLATARAEFRKDPTLDMISTYWGLARYVCKQDGTIENRYVVPTHPIWAVNTNCRVHSRKCIDPPYSLRFNTSKWGEDGDFFGRIEQGFNCKKIVIPTNVCGYIAGGNNITYSFDTNVKKRFF